jgi:hypothetical protein
MLLCVKSTYYSGRSFAKAASQLQKSERLPLPLKELTNKKEPMDKLYYPKNYTKLTRSISENSGQSCFKFEYLGEFEGKLRTASDYATRVQVASTDEKKKKKQR